MLPKNIIITASKFAYILCGFQNCLPNSGYSGLSRQHFTIRSRTAARSGIKWCEVLDLPAPLNAILDAHNSALLDDCGGHVNPHEGYHYHVVTGCSKEAAQKEKHSPLLGYALDGFGIYARLDKEGKAPEKLDGCAEASTKTSVIIITPEIRAIIK